MERTKGTVICLLAALFPFYTFFQMDILDALTPHLMSAYELTSVQVGWLASAYLYADALILLPAGIFLDHFSTRKLIISAFGLVLVGVLWFLLSHTFVNFLLARVFIGTGHAFALLSCFRLITKQVSPKAQGTIIGLTMTIAILGGTVAQAPLTLLIQALGWHYALLINLIAGVVIWTVLALLLPQPKLENHCKFSLGLILTHVWQSVKQIQNWLAGGYVIFLSAPMMVLGAVWGITYLEKIYGFSPTQASLSTTLIFIGMLIGSPIMGFLSDFLSRRRAILLISALVGLGAYSLFLTTGRSPLIIYMLFFTMGLFSSSQSLCYLLIMENNPRYLTSTAMSISNVIIMAGIATIQLIFSRAFSFLGEQGTTISLVHIQHGLNILPFVFILALIATFFMKEYSDFKSS